MISAGASLSSRSAKMVNPAKTMMIPVLLSTGGSSISGPSTARGATPRPASAPSRHRGHRPHWMSRACSPGAQFFQGARRR